MKQSIYFVATALLALAGCQQTPKNQFTINGSISGDSLEGKMVLLSPAQRDAAPIDTSYIAKNQFIFKQVVSNPEHLIVSFSHDTRKENIDVFSEANATANIVLDGDNSKASGTPLNDTYFHFSQEAKDIGEKYMDLNTKMRDPKIKEENKKALEEQLEQLMNDYSAITLKTTLENKNNIVGATLLPQAMDQLKPQETINLIDSMPEYLRSTERIQKIRKGVVASLKTQEGMPYLDFELQTTEGKPAKLSDYVASNKIVVIDFWASWCGPCRRSLPAMKKLYSKYHKKGLEIVGVSLDQKKDAWVNAIKEEGITWPQISDIKGWACKGSTLYGVRGIPSMFIIGKDGKIALSDSHDVKEVEKKVSELLK